jgi:hypothetical protein
MRPVAAVCALVLLGACGGGDDGGALTDAEDAMAELRAGRIELQLAAAAGGDDPTGPVGFRIAGPFSFEGDGALALADLTYTRLLGDEELTTQVVSTGDAVYVVTDGEVVELPP